MGTAQSAKPWGGKGKEREREALVFSQRFNGRKTLVGLRVFSLSPGVPFCGRVDGWMETGKKTSDGALVRNSTVITTTIIMIG